MENSSSKESTDEKLFSAIILLSLTFSPLSEKLTISSFSKLLARLVSIFTSSNEIVFLFKEKFLILLISFFKFCLSPSALVMIRFMAS